MKRAFAIFVSCIALIACDRYFDISDQVGESMVWMSFIPSNDYDTTFFILQATTPLVGPTKPVLTRGESVEVKVNGQTLSLEKSERSVPDKMQFYATTYAFKTGDRVEALATVPGTGSVNASCEVPEPFPAYSWKASLAHRTRDEYTLYVDLDYADSGAGGYFGAAVLEYCEIDSQRGTEDPETGVIEWGEVEHMVRPETALYPSSLSDGEGLAAGSEEPVSVSPKYYNYYKLDEVGRNGNVQIWYDAPGTAPAGGRRKITLAVRPDYISNEMDYYSEGSTYHHRVERRCKFRVLLYSFSESCYNYLKAQYNGQTSDFSEVGLAPASFVYTNVKGGAGVCGSYMVIPSDWFELPSVE